MAVYIQNELKVMPYKQPLTHTRLLFREPATYVAGAAAIGHQASFMGEFETAKYWTATGAQSIQITNDDPTKPMDSFGIVGSGLSDTITLYKTVSGVETPVMTASGVGDNLKILLFRPTVADSWRVTTTGPIAACWLSDSVKMPRPNYGSQVPTHLTRDVTYRNYVSGSGEYLGRFVSRRGLTFSAEWSNIAESLYDTDYAEAFERMDTESFFYAGRPSEVPKDCAYAWTLEVPKVGRIGTRDLLSISTQLGGYLGYSR